MFCVQLGWRGRLPSKSTEGRPLPRYVHIQEANIVFCNRSKIESKMRDNSTTTLILQLCIPMRHQAMNAVGRTDGMVI